MHGCGLNIGLHVNFYTQCLHNRILFLYGNRSISSILILSSNPRVGLHNQNVDVDGPLTFLLARIRQSLFCRI